MKLQELNKLNEFDRLSQLHEITKGYDKYLVAELLNNFYNEAFHEIATKYKDITESITIDPTAIYLNGFHFKHFGFDSWNKFTITIELHIFDLDINLRRVKPNNDLILCRELYDSIIKLENVLSDKCLNEIERTELTDCEIINNSIIKIYPKPIQNIETKARVLEDVYSSQPTKVKDYKDTIWFKTGIPLATGEAFDLYRKYKKDKGHFTKICLELGFKDSDRTYFSSTINDNVTDKNTFTSKDKLQKLHKYLFENGLQFGDEFLEKYNARELE
jgi:hypothetical protein